MTLHESSKETYTEEPMLLVNSKLASYELSGLPIMSNPFHFIENINNCSVKETHLAVKAGKCWFDSNQLYCVKYNIQKLNV